jgi:hypothetical protein
VIAALDVVLVGAEGKVVAAGIEPVPLLVTGTAGRDLVIVTDVAKMGSEEVETATTFGVVITAAAEGFEDLDLQADFLVLRKVLFR